MRVFLLPKSFSGQPSITLSGKDFHYLIHVLRYNEGSLFTGRALDGSLWSLLINQVDTDRGTCTVSCSASPDQNLNSLPLIEHLPEIQVYQCLLKGKKFDILLRQLVEIGISRIIPVQSEFTVPDLLSKNSQNKLRRWKQIRDEALQQSGSAVMTHIEQPLLFSSLPDDWSSYGLGIFFHHVPLHRESLKDIIVSYINTSVSPHFPVSIVIGPEGGLSDIETAVLIKAGFKPAFLKTNILRAETAALYASACTQMILAEKTS